MTVSKKYSKRQLHKKLWKLFSEYIRRRDADGNGYVACCSCGGIHQWKQMDCGHYISRSYMYHRYNEMNNHAQCKGCNAFRQGNPVGYRQFLIQKYGEEKVVEMEDTKKYPSGFTIDGLLLKIEEYKQKLK